MQRWSTLLFYFTFAVFFSSCTLEECSFDEFTLLGNTTQTVIPQNMISRTVSLLKSVSKVNKWGGYVAVMDPEYSKFDPFIFLVHHVHSFKANEKTGFPPHPHRGFETVTYAIEGGFEHGDSKGNKGTYGNGDVQWMTAGKGVLHSEMFLISDKPSTFNGFQLWLNLPQRLKMCEPDYLMLWNKDIPVAQLNGNEAVNEKTNTKSTGKAWIKIIAGRVNEISSIVEKSTPVSFFHVKLDPQATFTHSLGKEYHAFMYVLDGTASVGPQSNAKSIAKWQYCFFSNDGDQIEVQNTGNTVLDFLVLHGKPFNEPIAHQGPFVMTTKEELAQAFYDFQMGKFGEMDDP